eukprot:TRINITY_DN2780_c0_g1_i1.p1 TRINITY_DN2780_c0_g1~~TRINITY_DN2780_c0_g1_i1.p1  ORF type:complete len:249 (+),score=75.79 TRINITY_DN2780_c0_g1_i1:98-844(+)
MCIRDRFSGGCETHAAALAVEEVRTQHSDYYESALFGEVDKHLGQLNAARIGCCVLADHLVPSRHNRARLVQNVKVGSLLDSVCSMAEAICSDHYLASPSIEVVGNTAQERILTIPSHARYGMFELLKNACHATINNNPLDDQLAAVQVHLTGDAHSTAICVTDQGGGVPASVQPQVFSYAFSTSPLQPSDMGRATDCVTGCGVGLALSNTFVRYTGGSLAMEVEEGVGSSFTMVVQHSEDVPECFPE